MTEEVKGAWRIFANEKPHDLYLITKYYLDGDQTKKNEIGRACGTCVLRGEVHTAIFFWDGGVPESMGSLGSPKHR
jgi:hypothetical protein